MTRSRTSRAAFSKFFKRQKGCLSEKEASDYGGSTTSRKRQEPTKDREERQQGQENASETGAVAAIVDVNTNGMDPRGTTGTETTAIDRPEYWEVGCSEHWDDDRREEGGSERERPAAEERDERNEKVRITLSFLVFSAVYNLQRVRYRHTHTSLMESHRGTMN